MGPSPISLTVFSRASGIGRSQEAEYYQKDWMKIKGIRLR